MRFIKLPLYLLCLMAFAAAFVTPALGGNSAKMIWKNKLLNIKIDTETGKATLTNLASKKDLSISLCSPKLDFDKIQIAGGAIPAQLVRTDTPDGPRWTGAFAPVNVAEGKMEMSVWLQAYKDKPYVKKGYELKINGIKSKLPFKEIEMDRVDLSALSPSFRSRGDQSAPILCDSFFMGVEFPISAAKMEKKQAVLASRPGIFLEPGQTFKSRDVIYSVTEPDYAAKSFRQYVQEFRAQPADIFFGYNNWWTTPIHQNNKMMVDLAKIVKANLYDKYGVSPDVFTLDLGWSDREGIWSIDKEKFPNGFVEIKEVLKSMGTDLGFWVSPCSAYPEGLDNVWAEKAGYEVFDVGGRCVYYTCMAGKKYSAEFIKNSVDIVSDYKVKHIKFDAYAYHCPSTEHGHLPDDYSSEPVAQRIIDLYEAVRKAQPDIRLNPLSIGPAGSPWWLKYVNFMAGSQGDDYPFGRGAAPILRDSYTTAREYYTLKSATDPLVPMDCKEVFGVINQTKEPLFNDAVDVLMRGHQFITLYLHPNKTTSDDWKFVSQIIKYGRANKDILRNTTVIFPESWRQADGSYKSGPKAMKDPYGYVHADGKRALLYLRNPWMAEQTMKVKLDESNGFVRSNSVLNAVSVYPYTKTYATGLKYGDTIEVKLQPYRNVLIELSAAKPVIPKLETPSKLTVTNPDVKLKKTQIADWKPEFGPDWTKFVPSPDSGAGHAALKFTVNAGHDKNQVMVLVETPEMPTSEPALAAKVNGKEVDFEEISSKDGWAADSGSPQEHWTWQIISIPKGNSDVELSLEIATAGAELSVWLYGESAVANPGDSPLIHPNPTDCESAAILPPTLMAEKLSAEAAGEPKIEKIDGVYLDSMESVSSQQGWGKLGVNKSITGKRIAIGQELYKRGLGMHAQAEAIYNLDGKWSKFTAFAGPNIFERGSITMSVIVDGKTVWESGLMRRGDDAKKVDVDINGANTLTLIVGDGGDGQTNDAADWADATLRP
ncbi:MAG: NPCBM/NEW2 domain-containing protein [Armatimonadota bacterium]|nr:NPCBM/NEW2 domain-containing protein [Armatimonadota bacterium]